MASLGQKFDIVLLLGVYYHLLDPFYAFAQLRHCCHSGTIVCIEGNESIGLPDNTAGFNAAHGSNKFYPTNGYLRQLLETTYFSISNEQFLEPVHLPARVITPRWRYRMCRKAAFGSEADIRKMATQLILPQSERLQMVRRAFFTCGVFEGENPLHMYRPPFGLDAYDSRFKERVR